MFVRFTVVAVVIGAASWSAAKEPSEKAVNDQAWTVNRLAEGVRASMRRFDTVILEASYTIERNSNALSGKEPIVVRGSGSLLYRGEQERWFLRDDGFSFRYGTTETYPKLTISGYDGEIHFNGDQRRLTLGEEGHRTSARPRSLIWETILTYDYIDRAFDKETAEIVTQGMEEGLSLVDMQATWGTGANRWRLSVRFSPERSFLPISQRLWLNEKLYAESHLEQIVPVQDSKDWRPKVVKTKYHQEALGIIEKQHTISRFLLPKSLSKDDFRFDPPIGVDIIDRRTNLAWHSDPWWDALMPWMVSELDWPRYNFSCLRELRSNVDDSIDGTAAPPIDAAHWVASSADGSSAADASDAEREWKREDRKFSILYFFGDASRLFSPYPRWTTELGQLAKVIEPIGGEVIGIASSVTDPDAFRKTAKELMIGFPFAIDQDDGSQSGKTHQAFQLKHYFTVLVVDSQGTVHTIGEGDDGLIPTIRSLITVEDGEWLDQQLKPAEGIVMTNHDAIRDRWVRLRRSTQGRGTISGVSNPFAKGTVTLVPQFKMLMSNTPGGYVLIHDRGGQAKITPDDITGEFSFHDLPRGTYKLEHESQEGQKQSTTLTLKTDDDSAAHHFQPEL